MNKICGICEHGIHDSDIAVGVDDLDKIISRGEKNFDPSNFKAAVKLLLFMNGMTVYGAKVARAIKYIMRGLGTNPNVTLAALAAHYEFEIAKTRLRLKPDDPLATPPHD
jgi:hypothetical protein